MLTSPSICGRTMWIRVASSAGNLSRRYSGMTVLPAPFAGTTAQLADSRRGDRELVGSTCAAAATASPAPFGLRTSPNLSRRFPSFRFVSQELCRWSEFGEMTSVATAAASVVAVPFGAARGLECPRAGSSRLSPFHGRALSCSVGYGRIATGFSLFEVSSAMFLC